MTNRDRIADLKRRLEAWEAEEKKNSDMSEFAPKICREIRAKLAELEVE